MKQFINKYKRDIIIGVVVSLITTAIIKLWDWIVWSAPVFGKTFISTIDNLTYTMAASQSSSSLIRTIISFLLGIGLSFVIITVGKFVSTIRLSAKVDKMYQQIKKGNKEDAKKIISEIELARNPEKNFEIGPAKKKLWCLMIAFILSVILAYAFVDTTIFRPSLLWSKFENDITMIAPYVDDDNVTILKSKWICMREKEDYVDIYEYIDTIKEENNLPMK